MALILANWRRASHRYYLKLVSRVEGKDKGYRRADAGCTSGALGGVKLGEVSGTRRQTGAVTWRGCTKLEPHPVGSSGMKTRPRTFSSPTHSPHPSANSYLEPESKAAHFRGRQTKHQVT